MIQSLSLNEKVTLNQLLAAAIAEEVTGAPLKSAPLKSAPLKSAPLKSDDTVKTKKAKDPNAPKKAASPGVKAWNAFVKHCKKTQPELFKDTKKESERLAICGGIKERDTVAYDAWVKNWLTESSDSEISSPPSPIVTHVTAPLAPAPAAPATPPAAPTAEKKASKAAALKAAQEAAAAALAAQEAAAAALAAQGEDDIGMVRKTIANQKYLMDPESHELYKTNSTWEEVGENVGKWKGPSSSNSGGGGSEGEIDFHE